MTAHPDYIGLIKAFLEATKANKLAWSREKINRLLFSSVSPEGFKILLEQYYAENGDHDVPCLNLSIFKPNGDIVNEIVLCDVSEEKGEYELLRDLYWTIDGMVSELENEKSTPVIDNLKESIQKMVTV